MTEIMIGDEVIIEDDRSPFYGDVGIVTTVGEIAVGVQMPGGNMLFRKTLVSK